MRQGHRVVNPVPPDRQIGIIDLRVELAGPILQRGKISPPKISTDVDTRGEAFGRQRRQSKAMLPTDIVERKIHVFQNQRRSAAQCVLPHQRGAANTDVPLVENPGGDIAIAPITRERYAGNRQLAIAAAPQMQRRFVDIQQAQAQLAARHGPPGEYGFDPGKGQRRASFGVGNANVQQGEVRIDPGPAGLDAPDAHGLPQPLADQALDGRAVLLDVWQHDVAQCQNGQDEEKVNRPERPDKHPPSPADHRVVDERQQEVKAMVERRARFVSVHHGVAARGKLCLFSMNVTRMMRYV